MRKSRTWYIVTVKAAVNTPNLPERVDLVLIVDTYHHIGDREVYFRKLATMLTPGGRIAIIDFKPDSPEGPPREFRFSMGGDLIDEPGLPRVLGHDMPDHSLAQRGRSLFRIFAATHPPEQRAFR